MATGIDFESIYRGLPVAALLLDADLRILEANDEFVRLLGHPVDRLRGRHCLAVVDPQSRAVASNGHDAVFGDRSPGVQTCGPLRRRLVGASGQVFDALVRLSTIEDPVAGRLHLAVYPTIEPVSTPRAPLFDEHAWFHALFEHSPLPIAVQSNDWRLVMVNRAYCELTGYPEAALIGEDPRRFLIAPDAFPDLGGERAMIGAVVRDEDWRYATVREMLARDGTRIVCRTDFTSIRGLQGERLWCSTLVDLSRLEQAGEQARRQAAVAADLRTRLDAFATLIDDAIVLVDRADGSVRYCNHALATVLGVDPQAVLGGDCSRLWAHVGAGEREALAPLSSSVGLACPFERTLVVAHPSSGTRAVRLRAMDAGAPDARRYLFVEDITALLDVERARERDSIAQRDLLVQEVHHRIKNNLQGILGILQVAASRGNVGPQVLRQVASQVDCIAQVHGLLVAPGQSIGCIELTRTVSRSVDRIMAVEIGFEIRDDPASPARTWIVDERDSVPLALVLAEMLTNAVKHGDDSRPIRLTVESTGCGVTARVVNHVRTDGIAAAGRADAGAKGSGVQLIEMLLPRRGARFDLSLTDDGRLAVATLVLRPPAVGGVGAPAAQDAPALRASA